MRLLGVVAAAVNVGIRETGAPHHDAAKRRIRLVFADEGCELVGGDVVGLAAGTAIRSKGGRGHTEKDLGFGRRGSGNKCYPVIIVKGCIAVKT